MTPDRLECPVHTGEDTVALAGMSFGVGILSAMGATLVLMIATLALPGRLAEPVVLFGSLAAGLYAARRFWRWRRRVAAERKLVIDAAGITCVAYSGREETTRWEEIESVVQTVVPDSDANYVFVVHRRGRRNLKIDGGEFPDFEGIKEAIRRRIGDRLVLK